MSCRKPLAVTVAVLLGCPAAFAQTAKPAFAGSGSNSDAETASAPVTNTGASTTSASGSTSDTGTGEAVVITGSNIKRTDYEGPQTVKVIDRQSIDRSGVRTISDLIQRLPENSGGFSENVNNGISFSPGASAASLRGLGVSATLVLINGRRVTPFGLPQNGTDSFVDLNGIPISAVERVEILKEGASAIYGSDAIAGVINIILKDNYSGAEAETSYGNTTRNDAAEYRENFLTGFQNERFHIMITGNYYRKSSIADSDRSYSVTADHRKMGGDDLRSSFGNPGTVFASTGDFAVPRGSNGHLTPGQFLPGELADGVTLRNRYNFNKDSALTPDTERWGSLITFGYNLTPHLEAFLEASFQTVETITHVAPTPIDAIVPAANPFNPFGEDVEVLQRSVETGQRRDITDSDSYRYVTGLKFKDLPKNWSGELSYLYSENDVVDRSPGGYISQPRLDAALADTNPNTSLNLFGDGHGINNPSTLKKIGIQPHNSGVSWLEDAELKGTGELFNLPAGPVSLAIGGSYRQEYLSQTFSEPNGSVVSNGGAGSRGRRDVESLFIEGDIPVFSKKTHVPLLQELELTLAERYDHYSDFGETTKPKLGFKYKPFDGLLFRGSYAEGFRAPSLPQLFSGQVQSFDTVVNPRTGQVGDVPITTGGDPHLKPENSYSYFFGTIVEPPFIKGLSIEVDFYHIQQRNLILQPSSQDIIDGRAAGTVTYDNSNQITNINALFTNLGEVVVEGEDFDVNYKWETKIGTFTFDSSSSYNTQFKQSATAGAPLQNLVDSYSVPDFKMVNSIFYRKAGFEAGATLNYIDSYDDTRGNLKHAQRTVGSWTTVDLQMSYEWVFDSVVQPGGLAKDGKTTVADTTMGVKGWRSLLNHTKLTLGCNNVGDSQPPFSNIEEGYDTATADPTGRFIYASLRKKFW